MRRMLMKVTATDARDIIKIQKVCACKYLFALNIYSNRTRGVRGRLELRERARLRNYYQDP